MWGGEEGREEMNSKLGPQLTNLVLDLEKELDFNSSLEEVFNKFYPKLESVNSKIRQNYEKQCGNQIQWINENQTTSDKDLLNKKIAEFRVCTENNDLGLGELTQKMGPTADILKLKLETCVVDSKLNRNSVKTCLKQSMDDLRNMYDVYINKFDEINNMQI